MVGRNSELKQQFLFPHFTGRPHTSVIGARNLCLSAEPKGAFLWGLETLLPNLPPALFCLSCQISLHSLPQCFGPGQVILVPSLLLGKETHVQPSIFKCLFFPAACFPSGSLSSHHPSRLCSSLPGPAPALGCLAGLSLGTELCLLLDAFPHPTQPLTSCFLFVFPSSPLFVEFGATSLVTHLLSASSFLPLFQCSGFIYSVGQAFIFIPCGLFLKQSSGIVLLMYLKVLQIFFCFISSGKSRMHKSILRCFKEGGMRVDNWKNKLLLIELCVRPSTVCLADLAHTLNFCTC